MCTSTQKRIRSFLDDVFSDPDAPDTTIVFAWGVLDEHGEPVSDDVVERLVAALNETFRSYAAAAECWLYVWYDALIGQVRAAIAIGSVSQNPVLPFTCPVNAAATVADIAADVRADLASLHRIGVLDVMCIHCRDARQA